MLLCFSSRALQERPVGRSCPYFFPQTARKAKVMLDIIALPKPSQLNVSSAADAMATPNCRTGTMTGEAQGKEKNDKSIGRSSLVDVNNPHDSQCKELEQLIEVQYW